MSERYFFRGIGLFLLLGSLFKIYDLGWLPGWYALLVFLPVATFLVFVWGLRYRSMLLTNVLLLLSGFLFVLTAIPLTKNLKDNIADKTIVRKLDRRATAGNSLNSQAVGFGVQWADVLRIVDKQPLLGLGGGQYLSQVREDELNSDEEVDFAVNPRGQAIRGDLFLLAAEMGITGMVLLFGFGFVLFLMALNNIKWYHSAQTRLLSLLLLPFFVVMTVCTLYTSVRDYALHQFILVFYVSQISGIYIAQKNIVVTKVRAYRPLSFWYIVLFVGIALAYMLMHLERISTENAFSFFSDFQPLPSRNHCIGLPQV